MLWSDKSNIDAKVQSVFNIKNLEGVHAGLSGRSALTIKGKEEPH